MSREWAATNRFRGEGVAIDRHVKLPAKHLEPADVIAVLVREEHTIELLGRDPAKPEAMNQLTCTEPAIDEEPAMVGHEQGRISGAATSEHREAEHDRL